MGLELGTHAPPIPNPAPLTTWPLPPVTAAPPETGFNNLVPRVSLLLAWEEEKPWERGCGCNSLSFLTKVPNNKQIYPLVNLDLMSWTAMSFAAVKGHAHVCQVCNNLSLALGYVAKKTILIVLIIRTARFPDLCTHTLLPTQYLVSCEIGTIVAKPFSSGEISR